jgi:ATP-dependent protease Clp ATPase subunit
MIKAIGEETHKMSTYDDACPPYAQNIIYEDEIREYLTKYISGQKPAIELFSFIGHMYTLKQTAILSGKDVTDLPKSNALFVGPTGMGKTNFVNRFRQSLQTHYMRLDCSAVAAEGWHGNNLSNLMKQYLKQSPLGFGILHFDEIDKLAVDKTLDNQEGKLALQLNLLDILDCVYSDEAYRNLGNALIIMTGSFQKIRNEDKDGKKKKEKYSRPIGFNSDIYTIDDSELDNENKNWKERLVEIGFAQEFASRIISYIELEPYTTEEIKHIITNTNGNTLSKYKTLFGQHIELSDTEVDEIAQEVQSSDNGMREVDTIIFNKVRQKRLGG